jgi:hypothetical protein
MTNRSKLKEDVKKLLDLFPDLKHDIKHIIAEGESIAVFNKWKSSKGNSIVASKRQITKWDEIPFFPKEWNRYLIISRTYTRIFFTDVAAYSHTIGRYVPLKIT